MGLQWASDWICRHNEISSEAHLGLGWVSGNECRYREAIPDQAMAQSVRHL
jgi:hypothetical protein